MADTVNVGTAPNNNTGDLLRTAFQLVNARFELDKSQSLSRDAAEAATRAARDLEIEGQVASIAASFTFRGNWTTATVYNAGTIGSLTDRREIVKGPVGGAYENTAYVVMVDHTSGTFLDDLAAGKLLNTDAVQLAADLLSTGTTKGAHLVAGVDVQLADYTALRSYAGNKTRVYVTGALAAAAPQGISGVFVHRSTDAASADNGGTIIVDGTGRRWHREHHGGTYAGWWFDNGSDRTDAFQAALDYWAPRGGVLSAPAGIHDVSDSLLVNFSTTNTAKKRVDGYGWVLNGASVSGDVLTFTVSGAATLVRNLVIEGLGIVGSSSANRCLVLQGPKAGDSYFYNLAVRDVTASGFSGLHILGNVFESTIQDCHISCPVSATTGYPIYIDTSGGSGAGSGGVISSITLMQNTTRGGIFGVRVSATSNDVNIIGGTYLLAQEYGIANLNAQGGYIKGAHVESNWQSNPGLVSGQSGIYAVVSGSFTIENIFAVRNSSGQANAARVFVAGGAVAHLHSGVNFGGIDEFYVGGAADSRAIIYGNSSWATSGTVSVTQFDGLRATVPIKSSKLTRLSGVGPFTPSSANNVMHLTITSNITINAPSFTPNVGDELEFMFEQSGAGGNTVAWNAVFLPGAFVPTATYGRISTIKFRAVSKFTSANAVVWVSIATGTT